jgi:hypothetical protein
MNLIGHRPADYATMAESVTIAVLVELGLKLMSVAEILARLERLQPARNRIFSRHSYPLPRFASAAYRLLPIESTCLRESLVLYALLRRRGATPRFCVGVKRDGLELAAHAWIACDGSDVAIDAAFVELTTSA